MALTCSSLRPRACTPARSVITQASSAKFLVGGNWKCNSTLASVKHLAAELNAADIPSEIDVICAPPSIYIPAALAELRPQFQIAAQNCWTGVGGAYTGEVCADMLVDLGVPWVITGHSERRALCGESSVVVGTKSAYAISKGLKVIGCVGESLKQRQGGQLWDVLTEQMSALKASVASSDWDKLVIAYEPVWAIGTGVVASPEQAQEVHAFLRKWVSDNLSPEIASTLRIIYGGSVKASNSVELASQEDIDGFLVGGASLNGKEFAAICNCTTSAASAA